MILLDIEMPNLNGMDAARIIRDKDENVVLMFITNMAQYAIHGYSVGALDFVMKPITYYTFSLKMTRALKRVQTRMPKYIEMSWLGWRWRKPASATPPIKSSKTASHPKRWLPRYGV